MTRELNAKSCAALLKNEFLQRGVKLAHTEALDLLVARLKGYEAWSHLAQATGRNRARPAATSAAAAGAPGGQPESVRLSLHEVFQGHYGAWGSHPLAPREDWQYEVSNGDTGLGYWEWACAQLSDQPRCELPDGFRPRPASVALPDGGQASWDIEQNLTDRWGDLNGHAPETKPGLVLLAHDPELLAGLVAQMWPESTFVVRKDGVFGILFEVEYLSRESEGDEERASPLLAHADIVALLLKRLAELAEAYPTVEFCVPDRREIDQDRPAVWAFVSSAAPLQPEARDALGQALSVI